MELAPGEESDLFFYLFAEDLSTSDFYSLNIERSERMALKDWSTVAAENNFDAPYGWPENMRFREVNDAARNMMATIAQFNYDTKGNLSAESSSADTDPNFDILLEPSGFYDQLEQGMSFSFRMLEATDRPVRIAIDSGNLGLDFIELKDKRGRSLSSDSDNQLKDGIIYSAVFNGTDWNLK